jgi:hypothetical protein
MVLHCASRLGILSWLYSKRHDIAYHIGLIAELPIAMCNGEYFAKQSPLLIKSSGSSDTSMPVQFAQATEILLFIHSSNKTDLQAVSKTKTDHNTAFLAIHYRQPVIDVFHPPCEANKNL